MMYSIQVSGSVYGRNGIPIKLKDGELALFGNDGLICICSSNQKILEMAIKSYEMGKEG